MKTHHIFYPFCGLASLSCLVLLGILLTQVPAIAGGGMSGWSGPEPGKLRLIAGGPSESGGVYAGVEFKLEPGWKTYWRAPGDSGIPPTFDWTGSENLNSVKVHWPTPTRFKDEFGHNVGYKSDVLFPLTLVLQDPKAPATVKLSAQFGICREICIPAEARLSLTIPAGGVAENQSTIDRALEQVPKNVVPGLEVKEISARQSSGKVVLDVNIGAEKGLGLDVFVEGPADYYYEMPEKNVRAEGDGAVFSVGVDGVSLPENLKGKAFTVTVVQGNRALERSMILE